MKRAGECECSGAAEVVLCRKDPKSRLSSALPKLAAGRWRAALGRAAARFPVSISCLLFVPGKAASALARLPLAGYWGQRVQDFFESIFFVSGAIKEAGGWESFRRDFAMRLPVLCYHHMGTRLPGSWPGLTVPPAAFEEQMDWLVAQGYTGIHAADWLSWISEGTPLPEKPVLITFDDGYADLVHQALPALKARGFKATMFIVSQHIGDASSWDLPLGYPQRPLMTAMEIREAAARGIEIGAHTRTHRDLRTLTTPELMDELEGCRNDLSELIGGDVNIFAYPFGFNNEAVRQCAGAVYDLSFGCKPGLNHWRSDRRQLRRMFIYPNPLNFTLQVKYGVDLYGLWCIARDHAHSWIRRFGPEIGHKQGRQTAVDDLGAAK